MRNLFIAAAAALAALAAPIPAFAADWSGRYLGAVVGANVGGEDDVRTTGTAGFRGLIPNIAPDRLSPETEGTNFGVAGGFLLQRGALVYGVEGEIGDFGLDSTARFSGAPIPGLAANGITTSATRSLGLGGALRGRIGLPLGERGLIFASGGLAIAQAETAASVVVNGAPTVAWTGATEDTLTGWTLGAGGEVAVSDRIRLRGEYLYYDLGEQDVTAAGNAAVRGVAALNGVDYVARTDYTGGLARLGLFVKF